MNELSIEEIIENIHRMRVEQMNSYRDPPEKSREIEKAILALQEKLFSRLGQDF